ncbi:MAG: hypothetical protein MUC91_04780 [Verrucomicrobia bacterium]|nr:hypothetical protein [Verrucomicrobiota bacterium]
MNTFPSTKTASRCWLGAAVLVFGAATALQAADLDARIQLRPLTPQEIKDYSLTGAQRSGGLGTVGLGQPGYVDVLVNIALPPSENVTVSFVATNEYGMVVALENSPLGTNVPPYGIEDRAGGEFASRVAGRTMLRPKLQGRYTVVATVNSATSGSATLTQEITAGTYMGRNTCALCHSGSVIAPNKWGWTNTAHASAFTMAIDGVSTDHFNPNCISCHVVGYDANTNAVNMGWDDVAAQVGWTFPPIAVSNNWDHMDPKLKNVSNVQCENCHGAGSVHTAIALSELPPYTQTKKSISVNLGAGNCAQCHDSLTHHYKTAEYNNSLHGRSVEETGSSCARCHEAQGFINFAEGKPAVSVEHQVISCAACHTLHNGDNPHQIRSLADVTLLDTSKPGGPTVVTEGGNGKLCMQCHISRRDAVPYVNGKVDNRFGPHHGPQTDMLVGANAITYGQSIPSSAHYASVEESCVACHMQPLENGDTGFTEVGGHTFKMRSEAGVELVESCRACHGEIESFDFARKDYDGNGVIEGVQTEVKGLLTKLAMLLPPVGQDDVTGYSDYKTLAQKQGLYNYLFVEEDGSFGVHNLSYAVGILNGSIAALTDDANNDKLPDSWQKQYFTGINDPNAAYNATPAGDGMPNWLKYALGLDPWTAVQAVPYGYVYAQGKKIGGAADMVHIYTAAEVAFDTEIGKNYQIQAVSELSLGWQNLGDPIPGTGNAISYVTPTRDDVQQYFRVQITTAP